MALYHPELGAVSCKDCQTWIYDIKKGEQLKRGGNPQRRKPHQPTPCESCPRKSPENEVNTILMRCNEKTLMLFLAVGGGITLTLEESADPLLRHNFAMLQIIYDNWRQKSQALELTSGLIATGIFGK